LAGILSILITQNVCNAQDRMIEFPLPKANEGVVGELREIVVSDEDTFSDISDQYGLGYDALRAANPNVDPWLPKKGDKVILPEQYILPDAPREGIVINVVEMSLFYYPKVKKGQEARVEIYSISIGRREWGTPITETTVTGRAEDPEWRPPQTIRDEHAANGDPLPEVVPAGPDNPLGKYLLTLGVPTYFIHGTNKRFGIGMQVTHGCIRMYPVDIEHLVKTVPTKTKVRIVNQPYKIGWKDNELFLEVHPDLENASEGAETGIKHTLADVENSVLNAVGDQMTFFTYDKSMIKKVYREARGIPVLIGYLPAE